MALTIFLITLLLSTPVDSTTDRDHRSGLARSHQLPTSQTTTTAAQSVRYDDVNVASDTVPTPRAIDSTGLASTTAPPAAKSADARSAGGEPVSPARAPRVRRQSPFDKATMALYLAQRNARPVQRRPPPDPRHPLSIKSRTQSKAALEVYKAKRSRASPNASASTSTRAEASLGLATVPASPSGATPAPAAVNTGRGAGFKTLVVEYPVDPGDGEVLPEVPIDWEEEPLDPEDPGGGEVPIDPEDPGDIELVDYGITQPHVQAIYFIGSELYVTDDLCRN